MDVDLWVKGRKWGSCQEKACHDLRQTRVHVNSKNDSVAVEINSTELGNVYHTTIFVGEFSAMPACRPAKCR